MLLPQNPAIKFLGIYTKEWKTYVHPKMDIYRNFIHKAQTWKQPGYPSVDEWINYSSTRQQNI